MASEAVVLAAHAAGEIACTVVRPGDVYGPRSRPWTVLPVEMLKAGRMVLPAGGRGIFSPVYVDNLVEGIALAGAAPGAAGQVFILTDGAGVTTGEYFGRYAALLGVRPPRTAPTEVAVAIAALAGPLDRLWNPASEINPMSARYLARRGTYSIEKARRVAGVCAPRRPRRGVRADGPLAAGAGDDPRSRGRGRCSVRSTNNLAYRWTRGRARSRSSRLEGVGHTPCKARP